MSACHKSVNLWYLVFLFLNFPEGAVGRTYFFTWLIFRKSTLISENGPLGVMGKAEEFMEIYWKSVPLMLLCRTYICVHQPFLCSSNICCCSSSPVLHTISSLYDFSKNYLITFLCFTWPRISDLEIWWYNFTELSN